MVMWPKDALKRKWMASLRKVRADTYLAFFNMALSGDTLGLRISCRTCGNCTEFVLIRYQGSEGRVCAKCTSKEVLNACRVWR